MSSQSSATRSRRSLLAGLAGAAATAVASSFGQARPAAASHDGAVLLGHENSTLTRTAIANNASGGTAIRALGDGTAVRADTSSGTGVYGYSPEGTALIGESASGLGIWGTSTSGPGISGTSDSGPGISGGSDSNVGVFAGSGSTTQPAALARAYGGNTGVEGYSGPNMPPASPAKTGIFGYADQDSLARGVTGQTTVGRGVNGVATTGIAGHFEASPSGTALKAVGKVSFSTAGLASVRSGTKNVLVTPRTDIVTNTAILCTLESNQAGLSIQRLTKDAAANTFRVFLSANVLGGKYAKVAWFVIG